MVFTRSRAAQEGLREEMTPERNVPQNDVKKHGAPKRKLFDPSGEPEASREVPIVSRERSQSVPSAPPTPKTVERERPVAETPVSTPLHPALEPTMVLAMQGWRSNLVALQPKVDVADVTVLGAMALMREFAAVRPDVCGTLHSSAPHLFTYTSAAMWLVSKTCDVRTAIPNRTLMSQACQIHPQALSDFELDLCISLNWEVTKVLRANDLLQ